MLRNMAKPWAWIGLVALAVSLLYIATMLTATDGRPVVPLDDAYIHFQYARQIARGHPWQYNDDDPYSTGATSLLYPFILAAAYLLGFSGEHLVWPAMGLGALNLAASAWLIHRLTSRLLVPAWQHSPTVARWAPTATTLLFLLTGAVQWGYLNGMESGLFTLLVLATLDVSLAKRDRLAATWVALVALVRPEGLFMVGVFWLVVAGQNLRRSWRDRWHALWPVTVALLVSSLPWLVNLALTGSPIATGAQAKSWMGNIPFRLLDILRSMAIGYLHILERMAIGFLAAEPWFLAPGVLPLAAVGWIVLVRRRQWAMIALTGGWFSLGTLATATLITATWHAGRYQLPFLAILTPLAALGAASLLERAPAYWRTAMASALACGLLILSVFSTHDARLSFSRALHTIAGQQLTVADWIDDNLPPNVRVGVHDTGSIRYVGHRPTFDLIGLTIQGEATAWRNGIGAVFEQMERSPARPDYFATYPDVFFLPYLLPTDLFATELFRVEVSDYSPISAAGPSQVVYQADWRLTGSGDLVYQADMLHRTNGMTLLSRIDLADLSDETAHDLRWWEGVVQPGFPSEVRQLRYRTDPTQEVIDGGRLLTGGLSFHANAQPGQPLLLVTRLHPIQAGAVRVTVNDHDLGLWRYPDLPGEWLETAFAIPAEVVDRAVIEIRLDVEKAATAAHYGLYHLWLWQGESAAPAPTPTHPLSARLGNDIELVGYDFASGPYTPGQTIPLALYWRAAIQPTDDVKVFVHLYDGRGTLVAQQDRRPYYGTRPPYTWSVDEQIDDPYALALPPDLPPGRYYLAVGMYDPLTGARLPIEAAVEHVLPDNRILLDTLTVENKSGDNLTFLFTATMWATVPAVGPTSLNRALTTWWPP